ncbi:MAG TPA: LysR family transcriptional regulator [Xanthobacteraceae bacterium]|nr:LysR family transcriptional regulator [Xanthobacteraceae bacterium]
MDARLLEYFLRTVEHGSINRAADELGLAQPSLSRWLSLLEHDIGTPLLIRSPRGIALTDAGALLVERSPAILHQIDLLRHEIGAKTGTQVAIGLTPSMQRVVTAPFIESCAADQPKVTLRVYEGINNALRRWMEDALLDVALLVSLERAPAHFEVTPLVRERMMLVAGRSAGLSMDRPVPLSRLADAEIIMPGRPNVVRAYVENSLRRAGLKLVSRIEAETLSLCIELSRRDLGHTPMPYCVVHGRLGSRATISAAPIKGLFLTWNLCVNRARAHTSAVRRVAAALRQFVAERIACGDWPYAELLDDRGA